MPVQTCQPGALMSRIRRVGGARLRGRGRDLRAGRVPVRWRRRPGDDLLRPHPGAHRPAARASSPTRPGIDIDVRYGDSRRPRAAHRRGGRQEPGRRLPLAEPGRDRVHRLPEAARRSCPDSILDQVPERFRADDGDWVGTSGPCARARLQHRARSTQAELPQSVFDVTEPEYRGPGRGRAAERVVPGLRHGDARADR